MQFKDARLETILQDWCLDPVPAGRACGHNLRDDERLGGGRGAAFEACAQPDAHDVESLRRAAIDYYHERVRISHAEPETFTPVNDPANLGVLSPEQKLVRLECLSEPLAKTGMSFEVLRTASSASDAGSRTLVETFIEQWNTRPDIRRNPISFAAFSDQLIEELAASDWPDKLRDRLGLPHFDPVSGPIPMVLVEYEVSEIVAMGKAAPFYAPTALDGTPYHQFFPTPTELNFGCPMALHIVRSDDELIAEVLHPRLSYRRKHLRAFGLIEKLVAKTDFVALRNTHVLALRLATLRDGFGTDL